MQALISARKIFKRFGALEVLRGIDIDIERGKITTIVGPSGAGKTTLLHILGTLGTCEKGGAVTFAGTDVLALGDRQLSAFRNRNIGFVFQKHQLLPEFTIAENVALPAMIGGENRAAAIKRAAGLLESLGLGDRLHHRPSELSGGECQRAAVARALINKPPAILADEPSGSLDSENRRQLHRLFFDLRDTTGTTMVIVTHDNSLAAESDTVIRMADGKIVK